MSRSIMEKLEPTARRWSMMSDDRVPRRPTVSRAEVKAAQMKIRRMLARGEEPSGAIVAIANAAGDFAVPRTQPA